MTRAKVEREVAAAVLAGTDPAVELLRNGLRTLAAVRHELRTALTAAFKRKGTRDYVWTKLPHGGKLLVHLRYGAHTSAGMPRPLVTVVRARSGKKAAAHGIDNAVGLLTDRLGSNVVAINSALLAIERARRQCYALAEESTRWL